MRVFVDAGFGTVKTAVEKENKIIAKRFNSAVREIENQNYFGVQNEIVSFKDLHSGFKSQEYEIGLYDHALEELDTKLHENHELFVFTAIAKVVQDQNLKGEAIELNLIIPLSEFRNGKQSEYINKYNNRNIKAEINKVKIDFFIYSVRCYPEGQGVLFSYLNQGFKNKLIVDHGGQNITYILFNGQNPVPGKNTSDRNGVLRLIDKVVLRTNEGGRSLKDKDILDIIQGLSSDYSKKTIDKIKKTFSKEAYSVAEKVKTTIRSLAIDSENTEIIFSGGGAEMLKEVYQDVFSDHHIRFGNAFDNVRGICSLRKLVD